MNLDSLDVRILRALQADARLSFRELARRTETSVPTASARVGRLERLGVLRGYRADVDPLQLGETSIFVVVRAARGRTHQVAELIAKLPEVRRAMETRDGGILAEAIVPRDADVDRFLKRLGTLGGVASLEHYLASGRVKDVPRARIAARPQALVACYECGKTIEDTPIVRRLDRRENYFCCRSCEDLFVERYRRLKAAA